MLSPLANLVLALSSLVLLGLAIATSDVSPFLRGAFVVAAGTGAVWAILHYRQQRR